MILHPVILFELGPRIQVFHYQTDDERAANKPPVNIYWQDRGSGNTYGPFPSIYDTMKHYNWFAQNQRPAVVSDTSIVYVDFVNKKRIVYSIP